ncbi:class I SAM-dependent methyltransferase [Streptomyces actuosus]|uniref:Class I SAM-dependent methyltransferase n=1 Tax=Streptomyces actuosus TaxID=1885 RepID=A0ABS2W129_STRAS|nr:class I SAM-dependent methyltransferase [Streptomyces actuosus]
MIAGAERGPRRFVLRASGMAPRARRLPFPATSVYEVDRPGPPRLKATSPADAHEPVRRRVAVGAHLAGDRPRSSAREGFRAGSPTCRVGPVPVTGTRARAPPRGSRGAPPRRPEAQGAHRKDTVGSQKPCRPAISS